MYLWLKFTSGCCQRETKSRKSPRTWRMKKLKWGGNYSVPSGDNLQQRYFAAESLTTHKARLPLELENLVSLRAPHVLYHKTSILHLHRPPSRLPWNIILIPSTQHRQHHQFDYFDTILSNDTRRGWWWWSSSSPLLGYRINFRLVLHYAPTSALLCPLSCYWVCLPLIWPAALVRGKVIRTDRREETNHQLLLNGRDPSGYRPLCILCSGIVYLNTHTYT